MDTRESADGAGITPQFVAYLELQLSVKTKFSRDDVSSHFVKAPVVAKRVTSQPGHGIPTLTPSCTATMPDA